MALSWQWNKREKQMMSEMVESLRLEMDRIFKEQQLDPLPTSQLCDVLKATAEEGHVDAYVQVADFAAALADAEGWHIDVHEKRRRPPGAASAAHHVDDVIFRASRRAA